MTPTQPTTSERPANRPARSEGHTGRQAERATRSFSPRVTHRDAPRSGHRAGRQIIGLALGDDRARALGVPIGLVRGTSALAITVLCGAATAAAGPIAFVGLMIPHAVRLVTGPDNRWIMAYPVVAGPILLVVADIIGRLVAWPAELRVGIVTAFLGAPVLILHVRRTERGGM